MHLWVRLHWFFCTLHRHEFHLNDVPAVTWSRKMSLHDTAGAVEDWLGKYFTGYWQQIVGWQLLPSQYRTSLQWKDMTVSLPYSEDYSTWLCAWASVECNSLCWFIYMPLSHCWYVAVWNYRWWGCYENQFTDLSHIYGSQYALLHIRNVLHAIQGLSGAHECRLTATKH